MPDNKKILGPQDQKRINVNEDYEVRDWASRLNVTQKEIRDAVREVGDRAVDVKQYLGK